MIFLGQVKCIIVIYSFSIKMAGLIDNDVLTVTIDTFCGGGRGPDIGRLLQDEGIREELILAFNLVSKL